MAVDSALTIRCGCATYCSMEQMKACSTLKQLMAERGFTGATLGARLGVNKSTVSRWLSGSRPTAAIRLRLEGLLGMPHTAWLTRSELKAIRNDADERRCQTRH